MTQTVYLDHNATTPLDRRALEAMMPYLTGEFGNPSSNTHQWGLRARQAVEEARASVAHLVGAGPEEIVFTSGATEANNLAIKGACRLGANGNARRHVVTTAIEHPSVSAAVSALEKEGFETVAVLPDALGTVHPETLLEAVREDTVLVSVPAANGEIGTLQPVREIAARCREQDVIFHSDATQAVGKIPVDVTEMNIDLLAMSSHKLYGPKGVGALFVRAGIELEPIISGGGQERGLRPGTLNVPGIVGLGVVARLCLGEMEVEAARQRELCRMLWDGILKSVPDAKLNGHAEHRLPGTLNVAFPQVNAERMMLMLKDFAFSASSACHSDREEPSPVLSAIGLDADLIGCSVRFGLGKGTTAEDIERLVAGIDKAVRRIRGPVMGTTSHALRNN